MTPHGMRRPALGTVRAALAAAAGVLALAVGQPAAVHAPEVSDAEAKCQQNTTKVIGKLGTRLTKCIIKCQKGVAGGTVSDASECGPRWTGPTRACLDVETAKAVDKIVRACAADCPECYADGCVPAGYPTAIAEHAVGAAAYLLLAYCISEDSGSCSGGGTPEPCCAGPGIGFCGTPDERRCANVAATTFGKTVGSVAKCYAKCAKLEHQGLVSIGGCVPDFTGNVTDPESQACIAKAKAKARAKIDASCEGPGNDKPDGAGCDSTYSPFAGTAGSGWADAAVYAAGWNQGNRFPGPGYVLCTDLPPTTTTLPADDCGACSPTATCSNLCPGVFEPCGATSCDPALAVCVERAEGGGVCIDATVAPGVACASSAGCPPGSVCVRTGCSGDPWPPQVCSVACTP